MGRLRQDLAKGRLRDWERPARVFTKGCLWQENLAESVKETGRLGDREKNFGFRTFCAAKPHEQI